MDSHYIQIFLTCMAYSAAVSSVQFTLYHIAQSHNEHTDVNEITISWSLVAVYVV